LDAAFPVLGTESGSASVEMGQVLEAEMGPRLATALALQWAVDWAPSLGMALEQRWV
jgi:hypothetical protein